MNEQDPSKKEEPKIIGFESQPTQQGMYYEQTFAFTAAGVVLTLIGFGLATVICYERMPIPELGGSEGNSISWTSDFDPTFSHTPKLLDQFKINSFGGKRKSIIDESKF